MTRPFQRRELFALAALTAIAMLTWLWSRQGIDEDAPVTVTGAGAPGYYLHGASILGTDDEGPDSGPMAIRTSSLRLEPGTFDVRTDDPVTLYFGDRRLDAVGLNANLKAGRLALESSIHGEFGP